MKTTDKWYLVKKENDPIGERFDGKNEALMKAMELAETGNNVEVSVIEETHTKTTFLKIEK